MDDMLVFDKFHEFFRSCFDKDPIVEHQTIGGVSIGCARLKIRGLTIDQMILSDKDRNFLIAVSSSEGFLLTDTDACHCWSKDIMEGMLVGSIPYAPLPDMLSKIEYDKLDLPTVEIGG